MASDKTSPAYRATLLLIRWAQVKTALTFLHFACTSFYITCRRFEVFLWGTYGQKWAVLWVINLPWTLSQ